MISEIATERDSLSSLDEKRFGFASVANLQSQELRKTCPLVVHLSGTPWNASFGILTSELNVFFLTADPMPVNKLLRFDERQE